VVLFASPGTAFSVISKKMLQANFQDRYSATLKRQAFGRSLLPYEITERLDIGPTPG
jgi:hypothetical protein